MVCPKGWHSMDGPLYFTSRCGSDEKEMHKLCIEPGTPGPKMNALPTKSPLFPLDTMGCPVGNYRFQTSIWETVTSDQG